MPAPRDWIPGVLVAVAVVAAGAAAAQLVLARRGLKLLFAPSYERLLEAAFLALAFAAVALLWQLRDRR